VHARLVAAGVDIFASSGVTDGRGSFGYVVYVREDQFENAASAVEPFVLSASQQACVGADTAIASRGGGRSVAM
jgi:hypothetical protein